MKVSIVLMMITFALLLISIVGMALDIYVFKEIHGVLGIIFITLILVHLYHNRLFIKNMFRKKPLN